MIRLIAAFFLISAAVADDFPAGPDFDHIKPEALEYWKRIDPSFKWPMTVNYIQHVSGEDELNTSLWANYKSLKTSAVEARVYWFRAIHMFDIQSLDQAYRIIRVGKNLENLPALERARRLEWMHQRSLELKALKVKQRVEDALTD